MIPRLRFLAVCLAIVATTGAPLLAQKGKGRSAGTSTAPTAAPLDSVVLRYGFQPGTAISYHVVTHDTLYLYGANQLAQAAERAYIVTYACDSLTRDGIVLSMSVSRYVAREWRNDLPEVSRTSHPWTERTARFLMSYDGRRLRNLNVGEPIVVGPTGPFQPLVLPFIGSEHTVVGASELFDLSHWIVESVTPPILSSGSAFRTVVRRHDTLGVPTIEMSFSNTGRGTYDPGNRAPVTTATINGASRTWFSPMLGLPVAGEAIALHNLTLRGGNGDEGTGRQSVHMTYQMVIDNGLESDE
jgi:hypothetical protein